MSYTRDKLIEHLKNSNKTTVEVTDELFVEVPLDVQSFCQEMDEHIEQLEVDAKYPQCPTCGSCGFNECCPAHNCLHPDIKADTVKRAEELAEYAIEQSEKIREQRNRAIEVLRSLGWSEEALINSKIIDEGVHDCKGCGITHTIHPEMECSCCLLRR